MKNSYDNIQKYVKNKQICKEFRNESFIAFCQRNITFDNDKFKGTKKFKRITSQI